MAGQCRYVVLCLQAEGDFILRQVHYQVWASFPVSEGCVCYDHKGGERGWRGTERSAEADDQHNRRARPFGCHLLLMLMMYMASHDFVMLSLDGSSQVEEQLEEGKPATDCQLRITTLAGQPLTLWGNDTTPLYATLLHAQECRWRTSS